MRPPRLKLRTLVILVILATLAMSGAEYWRRAARYRALAAREATMESADRAAARAIRADWARMREAMERGTFLGGPDWLPFLLRSGCTKLFADAISAQPPHCTSTHL